MKNILLVSVITLLALSFIAVQPASGLGRPDNCDDTAYQAHPGYNQNKETWDRYTAETEGVCQSQYGRGVPSPCIHTVQLSVQGNPYYLCWYNVTSAASPVPIQQKSFLEDIIARIRAFFSQLFGNLFSFMGQNRTIIRTVKAEIGPYPGKWACDFYQIPWPGVNKKHVSCPYETPGAAINDAANAFCRSVMGSAWAEAEVCNEQGLIVCTHPCETTPPHIIPSRCAFDNDRPRGNQAPPLDWCPPEMPPSPQPSGTGRPDNCFDTAYQAHPGYNENKALWDSYMADTDGVCQTRFGTGTPSSPCARTVQLSVQGNPYYLCWYNND